MNSRERAIILIIHSPSPEKIFPEMKEIFGEERAIHISKDLYIKAYNTAENFDAIKIIGYSPTSKNFNLTWLSSNDPGFLEFRNESYAQMLVSTFNLAFNTGSLKAVYINHLCPFIKKEHIQFAFEKITDRNMVIGPAPNGRIYLIGITRDHVKILNDFKLWHDNMLEEISEKAKKNKFSVLTMEELPVIKDEESIRKWLDLKENEFLLSKNKVGLELNQYTSIEDKNTSEIKTNIEQNSKKHKKHNQN